MAGHSRRVALVTGASGAIGKAAARQIAALEGHEVVLACRDRHKAETAVRDIQEATGNQGVRYEIVDVSRRASVQELAARWQGPLHVLVNNAADAPRQRLETAEGLEVQFATNIMGYFWMIQALAGLMQRSAPARVVNVASYWAGGLDIEDLQFHRRRYNNDAAYRQSKQANRMLTVAFADRLAASGITVNACHPGDVSSALSNSLGFGGPDSPDQGARTPVWLATAAMDPSITGKYFENQQQVTCRFVGAGTGDRDAVEALYRACEPFG